MRLLRTPSEQKEILDSHQSHLRRLLRPIVYGRKHEHHGGPLVPGCGWCGNIRSWTAWVERAELDLARSQEIDQEIGLMVAAGKRNADIVDYAKDVRMVVSHALALARSYRKGRPTPPKSK